MSASDTVNTDQQDARVVDAAAVDPEALLAFLVQAFGPSMGRFRFDHADWLYAGAGMRFVALYGDVVAGYRAMAPGLCLFEGREIPAVWAQDLYVLPAFRGRGLQKLLDEKVVAASNLRMSFPNERGAKIYTRQGYGLRYITRVRVPLRPLAAPRVKMAEGRRGLIVKTCAVGASPLAAALRTKASRYRSRRTEITDCPDPRSLEATFYRHVGGDVVTTVRNAEFLQWRYFDAPYRSELSFYLTGPTERPTHYAVVQFVPHGDSETARVLDTFGDLDDEDGLEDLLRTIVRDAILRGAVLVEALATLPVLAQVARRAGFLASDEYRFRWGADDLSIHERFPTARLHWTYGDTGAQEM